MAVKFTSRIGAWTDRTAKKLDIAVLDLATTIHRDAGNLAPVLTGNLVNSGRVRRNGLADYSVIFGNSQVRYARKRHYQNRKNPQTLYYLKRAGDANSRNFKNNIRGL